MRRLIVFAFLALCFFTARSQNDNFGIGTLDPNTSAKHNVVSDTKDLLIPRLALNGTNDQIIISNGNVESLFVYNSAHQDLDAGLVLGTLPVNLLEKKLNLRIFRQETT